MSGSDKAFEAYWAAEITVGVLVPKWKAEQEKEMLQQTWNAATEQQREKILLIIEDVKTDHHARDGRADGYDLDTCDEILRRINEEQWL